MAWSDDDEQLDVGREESTSVTAEVDGRKVERLAVMADQSSESEEETPEGEESADERNVEAVVTNIVGPPRKANSDLYRHSLTGPERSTREALKKASWHVVGRSTV